MLDHELTIRRLLKFRSHIISVSSFLVLVFVSIFSLLSENAYLKLKMGRWVRIALLTG